MVSILNTVSRTKIPRQERDQDLAVKQLGPDMYFEFPASAELPEVALCRFGYLLATIVRHCHGLDRKYENIFAAIKLVQRNRAVAIALFDAWRCGRFGGIRKLALLQELPAYSSTATDSRDQLLSRLQILVAKPGEWSDDDLRLNDVELYDAANGDIDSPELEEIRTKLNSASELPVLKLDAPSDTCEAPEAFRSRLLQLVTSSILKPAPNLPWEFSLVNTGYPSTLSRSKITSAVEAVANIFRFPFAFLCLESTGDGEVAHILQAAALARLGQRLIEAESGIRFIFLLIIVGNQVAQRYVITTQKSSNKVLVDKRPFLLHNDQELTTLSAELLNWKQIVHDILPDLDNKKQDMLLEGYDFTSVIIKDGAGTPGECHGKKILLTSINTGPLAARTVKEGLKELGYTALYRASHFPEIGVVFSAQGQLVGYLKFIKERRYEEITIHERLRGIDSPRNHVVPLTRVWEVPEGHAILTTSEGGWLTGLKDCAKHLWDVARQLFEALEFLHEHEVAHMGLKPPNLIIPPEYGRLTVIDFGVSIPVSKQSVQHLNCGTPGYKAPEISYGVPWHPIKADRWAVGKVLSELCECCDPCLARERIRELSNKLMNLYPDERPSMKECLALMAEFDEQDNKEREEKVLPRVPRVLSNERSSI